MKVFGCFGTLVFKLNNFDPKVLISSFNLIVFTPDEPGTMILFHHIFFQYYYYYFLLDELRQTKVVILEWKFKFDKEELTRGPFVTFSAEFLALTHGSKLHLPKCNLKLREKLISTPARRFELLNSLPDGVFFKKTFAFYPLGKPR